MRILSRCFAARFSNSYFHTETQHRQGASKSLCLDLVTISINLIGDLLILTHSKPPPFSIARNCDLHSFLNSLVRSFFFRSLFISYFFSFVRLLFPSFFISFFLYLFISFFISFDLSVHCSFLLPFFLSFFLCFFLSFFLCFFVSFFPSFFLSFFLYFFISSFLYLIPGHCSIGLVFRCPIINAMIYAS